MYALTLTVTSSTPMAERADLNSVQCQFESDLEDAIT